MVNILNLIGRNELLFEFDIVTNGSEINSIVEASTFLVIGGAGSIGQAVVKEIFKRNPLKLHVVDISENNMVELVRDIRSSFGYIDGDFRTFSLDIGSVEYDAFIKNDGKYDYVLNLSALKHVRSEKDPFTLMRMIDVNIFNTEKTVLQAIEKGTKKYFCVSTEMRFILQSREQYLTSPIKRQRELESEFWHAKALEIACTFLPSECPLLNHILLSY
jgi:FlaA1/EpsC-like NDP-sugar epimerase